MRHNEIVAHAERWTAEGGGVGVDSECAKSELRELKMCTTRVHVTNQSCVNEMFRDWQFSVS